MSTLVQPEACQYRSMPRLCWYREYLTGDWLLDIDMIRSVCCGLHLFPLPNSDLVLAKEADTIFYLIRLEQLHVVKEHRVLLVV